MSQTRRTISQRWTDTLAGHVLLPAQRVSRTTSPEMALQIAVLQDAMAIVAGSTQYGHYQRRKDRLSLRAETAAWFQAPDLDGPFTCASICLSVGIDFPSVQRWAARAVQWRAWDASGERRHLRLIRSHMLPRARRLRHIALEDRRRRVFA